MLKHFAAATLGFAVLFGAIGPAAASKIRHHWIDQHYSPPFYSDQSTNYARCNSQSQPNIKLDFETEAVWRNLRPEWFD
jgi:hypothetical protein